ncbi:MAG TPA: GNAT family protein [Caulobacteraceae bacterium]|jgi:RimJ/RimL family protein N-acetyltransferase|nr:GNAT family protein [Caulobacteraceae bacterium]
MILKTERLSLRPLEPRDVPAVHQMMSDIEVMAFWDSAVVDDPAVTAEIVEQELEETEQDKARYWAMELASSGAVIGLCDLSEIDRRHSRADVGFMVARRYWGAGYTYEAMHAVIGHAAQGLRLRRLQARAHLGNIRSMRLLDRLGFKREGLLRGYVERDGERRDCALYGLLL